MENVYIYDYDLHNIEMLIFLSIYMYLCVFMYTVDDYIM